MRFGIKTGQSQSLYTYDELSAVWVKAEELGFESAWLHDHLYAVSFAGRASDDCMEAYSLFPALARDTKRIRFGAMVTCAGYRNPAYLAKVGATIDNISRGRFTMAIGAGWYEAEYKAHGYDFPSVPERIGRLREAVKILRLMWTESSPSFRGRYYTIDGASNNPMPVQKRIPIWIGISTGKVTLPAMAARLGDGLNSSADLQLTGEIVAAAEAARKETKRDRSEMTYSAQPSLLAGTESQREEIIQKESKRLGVSAQNYLQGLKAKNLIAGSPEQCAEQLRLYRDAGLDLVLPIVIGDRLLWPLELVKDKVFPLV